MKNKDFSLLIPKEKTQEPDTAHFFVHISYFSGTQAFCSACQKASRIFYFFFPSHRYSLTRNMGAFVLCKIKHLLHAFRDLHFQAL